MSEERLKEIKDSIYIAHRINCDPAISMDFRDKEDLYYEVVRLRETLNKINHVMNNQMDYEEFVDIVNAIDDILEQNNLTLEQLTGVENE